MQRGRNEEEMCGEEERGEGRGVGGGREQNGRGRIERSTNLQQSYTTVRGKGGKKGVGRRRLLM